MERLLGVVLSDPIVLKTAGERSKLKARCCIEAGHRRNIGDPELEVRRSGIQCSDKLTNLHFRYAKEVRFCRELTGG